MISRRRFVWFAFCLLVNGVFGQCLVAQSLVISQPEMIYRASPTTYRGQFYPCDAISATLRKDSASMYIFRSTWNATFRFWGPLSDAEQHPMFTFSKDLFTIPAGIAITAKWTAGAANYANIYLKNIYDLGSGELIGFLHLEYEKGTQGQKIPSCPTCPDYPAYYRIALCHSQNRGETWTFCGDIIGASDSKPGNCNIGGAAYLLVGDYFYVYFNDKGSGGAAFPSVARALRKDVIEQARRAAPQAALWRKYNALNGTWDQDALSGLGSRIFEEEGIDMHADAAYCNAAQKYLIAVRDNKKGGLYLFQSRNGLEGKGPGQLIAADYGEKGVLHQPVYPYFASLNTDASSDCSTVGREFFIYYIGQHFADRDNPPRQFIAADQPVFRVTVRVKD